MINIKEIVKYTKSKQLRDYEKIHLADNWFSFKYKSINYSYIIYYILVYKYDDGMYKVEFDVYKGDDITDCGLFYARDSEDAIYYLDCIFKQK